MFVRRNCASCNILWTEVLVVVFVSLVKCEAHSSTVSKDIWSLWSNSGDRRNEKTHKNDDGGRVEEKGAEVGEWCAHVLGISRVSPWGMECLYLRVAWICTGEEQRISNFSILLLYYILVRVHPKLSPPSQDVLICWPFSSNEQIIKWAVIISGKLHNKETLFIRALENV